MKNKKSPWVEGPIEILNYAQTLLKDDKDSSRRLCFLIIDNAVEVMLRTFLQLPERITSVKISRKEYKEVSESFPELLNLLEKKSKDKLINVDLGEIEYYHQQRNLLYHNGSGITIESKLVEGYLIQAKYLLFDLFEVEFDNLQNKELKHFLTEWSKFERWIYLIAYNLQKSSKDGVKRLGFKSPLKIIENNLPIIVNVSIYNKLVNLQDMRNQISHGLLELNESDNIRFIKKLEEVKSELVEVFKENKIDIK